MAWKSPFLSLFLSSLPIPFSHSPSINPETHPSFHHPPTNPFTHPPTYSPFHLPSYLSIYLSTLSSINPSSIHHSSNHPFIYLDPSIIHLSNHPDFPTLHSKASVLWIIKTFPVDASDFCGFWFLGKYVYYFSFLFLLLSFEKCSCVYN